MYEKEMIKTDFWEKQEHAREVMQQVENFKKEVEFFESQKSQLKDLKELICIVETDEDEKQLKKQYNIVQKAVEKMEFLTLFKEKYDCVNAIVEVHAGAGGVDAQDWAEMISEMYIKWAENHHFSIKILNRTIGSEAGIKSIIFEISGQWVYGHLRSESGVHRLVRLSPFNADNLRQTSFARIDVLPVLTKDLSNVSIQSTDIRIDTYRASGAGGQHVNTTDSAVRITHLTSGIQVQCQSERSQLQNKENAMKLLHAKLQKQLIDAQNKKQRELRGDLKEAAWGNQIRSYVLHPYKLVKDHRTQYETPHITDVLNGDIDSFIHAFLRL